MKYRDFHITRNPKPLPIKSHDWEYRHEGYGGPGDGRRGTAASEAECRAAVDEYWDECSEEAARVLAADPYHSGLEEHGEICGPHIDGFVHDLRMTEGSYNLGAQLDPRIDADEASGMTTQEIADATNRVNGYAIKGKPC